MMRDNAPLEAIAQDWAGLTRQGRILISIDRAKAGQPLSEIVAHERAHAVLIRNTTWGWVLNTLGTFGSHPWPAGATRTRCQELLGVLVEATRWTQEGLATFLARLPVPAAQHAAYRSRQPALYLRAADSLEWLRGRHLDAQGQADVALMVASLASGVPILRRWGAAGLTDVRRLQAWVDLPANHPDARFSPISRALMTLDDAELARIGAHTDLAETAARRLVTIPGAAPEFELMPDDTRVYDMSNIVRTVTAPLLHDPTLPSAERRQLAEAVREPQLVVRGLSSTRMSILVTETRGAIGRRLHDPDPSDLVGYDLAVVQYNAGFSDEPGLTPSGADPLPLPPRNAVVYLSGPGQVPAATSFTAPAFLDWLDALDDSMTLAVLDTSYMALGIPLSALPGLAARPHVVRVVGRTPHDLVLDVCSTFARSAVVLFTVNASDVTGVSYVMLRQETEISRVVLLPTVAETARETAAKLGSHRDGPEFRFVGPHDFFRSGRALRDVTRVIADFEGTETRPGTTSAAPCVTSVPPEHQDLPTPPRSPTGSGVNRPTRGRSGSAPRLTELMSRFLGAIADPARLEQIVATNPDTLGEAFDTMLLQYSALLREDGQDDLGQVVERSRALLTECRRLGVDAAFVKAGAYALVGGFLRAEGPDGKLAYLRAHPELDELVNRAALHQMIDDTFLGPDQDLLRFLRSHLSLLDLAVQTSPEEAVSRAFGQ